MFLHPPLNIGHLFSHLNVKPCDLSFSLSAGCFLGSSMNPPVCEETSWPSSVMERGSVPKYSVQSVSSCTCVSKLSCKSSLAPKQSPRAERRKFLTLHDGTGTRPVSALYVDTRIITHSTEETPRTFSPETLGPAELWYLLARVSLIISQYTLLLLHLWHFMILHSRIIQFQTHNASSDDGYFVI